MAQPYIGEIRMFAGNFPPLGWAFCDGQQMPISENDALFTLIGTIYGGDGQETFNLPNLCGRVPVHRGQGPAISRSYEVGEAAGVESVTLTSQQIPIHTHAVVVSNGAAASKSPDGNLLAVAQGDLYTTDISPAALSSQAVSAVGGSQPHENMQPYLAINYIISLYGIFPTQS